MREASGASTGARPRDEAAGDRTDQVTRWERFSKAQPGAEREHDAPMWAGSVTVRGKRLEARRGDLKAMIDDLERGMRSVVEGEFPAWTAWVADDGHWYATRRWNVESRLREGAPATVDDAGADGLCGQLADVEAKWARWS